MLIEQHKIENQDRSTPVTLFPTRVNGDEIRSKESYFREQDWSIEELIRRGSSSMDLNLRMNRHSRTFTRRKTCKYTQELSIPGSYDIRH